MITSNPWTNLLRPMAAALAVVLIAIALLLWRSGGTRSDGGAAGAVVALAQVIRMDARAAIGGDPERTEALQAAGAELARLASGGAAGLAPVALDRTTLAAIAGGVDGILAERAALLEVRRQREQLDALVPELRDDVESLRASLSPDAAVEVELGRLELALDGVERDLRALEVAESVEPALDRLGAAAQYFGQVARVLRGEDDSLGFGAAAGSEAAADSFDAAGSTLTALATQSAAVAAAQAARLGLDAAAEQVLVQYRTQPAIAGGAATSGWPLLLTGLALLLLASMALAYHRARDIRRAAEAQAAQNERNQQAILRLLDELSSLADGDLTVQATVTEDITGAIADSINYAIDALRELVLTINESSILVDAAAKQSEATARHLVRSSDGQAKQVTAASESVARMVQSIEEVSGNAERCSDVARHAVDVAHKGGEAVRRTIDGMNTIRETIQDTSKRIKRLGESSQEIGNIVELIEEIAEQTNILALNASIEASRAGDGSRGFAVVADEVQKLAERSTSATRKIEVLVSTIQSDTNEAVVSMERSTTDVVGGALLAENAGAALEEIEQVSHQIASLVQNISSSAREQSGATAAIIENMTVLRDISSKTTESTSAASSAISRLSQLASQLRETVAGFTLPDQPGELPVLARMPTTPESDWTEPAPSGGPSVRLEPRRRSG